jgi:hypothetical protein
MSADIDTARILQGVLEREASPRGPDEGPCPVCEEHGMVRTGNGIRYCLCRTGREKKKEWLALPAVDRAPFEAECPTLPDANDVVRRGA